MADRACIECGEVRRIHSHGRCAKCASRQRRRDPNHAAKDRAWSRAWKQQHKGECVDCGAPTDVSCGYAKASQRCATCSNRRRAEELARQKESRWAQAARLRCDGLLNVEIAEVMGCSPVAVASLIYRARREGFDVAPSPHYKNVA